jgi:hypothetical protein
MMKYDYISLVKNFLRFLIVVYYIIRIFTF